MIETLNGYLNDVKNADSAFDDYAAIMNPYGFIDQLGNLVLEDVPFISFQEPVFRITEQYTSDQIGTLLVGFILVNNKDLDDPINDLIELEHIFETALKALTNIGFTIQEIIVPSVSKELQVFQCNLAFEAFCLNIGE